MNLYIASAYDKLYVCFCFYNYRYRYNFPFLKTNSVVTVDDNRVGPLYKHVFPPALAPRISFIGIPTAVRSYH